MQDPRTAEPRAFPGEQPQPRPGLEADMATKPDHGEDSYRGKDALAGCAALITGGDSGIGRAVAIAYAREGADVAVSFLADEQADAEETKRWVEQAGRRCLLLPGDIRAPDHCAKLVADTVAGLGRLDILVANAAAQTSNEDLADITVEDAEGAMRANVLAPIWLAKAAVEHMQPGGSIIITGSVQSKVATGTMLVYAATKGAVASLTVGLSNLLAPKGIRVNCVAPGPVWTPIQPIAKDADTLETLGQSVPLGRAGQPGELAGAYVLLASEDGRYITGATIPVTGGTPMH